MQLVRNSIPRVSARPLEGAAFDFDFVRGIGVINGSQRNLKDVVQATRAGTARHIGPGGRKIEVAAEALRIAHRPNGAVRGLMIEPGMTPLITYSRDISNAAWTKSTGMAAVANAAIGTDGLFSATRITDSQAAASTRGTFSRTITIAADTTRRTIKIVARAGTMKRIKVDVDITSGGTVSVSATFNLQWGFVEASSGTTVTRIVPDAMGFVEASLTIVNASGTDMAVTVGRPSDADDPGYLDLDEIQAHTGGTPLSGLITTGSLTARVVDAPWMSLAATSSWFTVANGGTIYVDAEVDSALVDVATLVSINNTFAHEITLQRVTYAAALVGRITTSSAGQAALTFFGSNVAPLPYRAAMRWATNDVAGVAMAGEALYSSAVDGIAPLTDTSVTIPTNITRVDFGHISGTSTGAVCLRRVIIWQRPLDTAALSSLIV